MNTILIGYQTSLNQLLQSNQSKLREREVKDSSGKTNPKVPTNSPSFISLSKATWMIAVYQPSYIKEPESCRSGNIT